jgi:hypothetical protein
MLFYSQLQPAQDQTTGKVPGSGGSRSFTHSSLNTLQKTLPSLTP